MIIYNNEWYPETDNQVRYFELFFSPLPIIVSYSIDDTLTF